MAVRKWARVPVRDGEIASFESSEEGSVQTAAIVRSNGDYVLLVNGDAQAGWPPSVVQALLDYRASGQRV